MPDKPSQIPKQAESLGPAIGSITSTSMGVLPLINDATPGDSPLLTGHSIQRSEWRNCLINRKKRPSPTSRRLKTAILRVLEPSDPLLASHFGRHFELSDSFWKGILVSCAKNSSGIHRLLLT